MPEISLPYSSFFFLPSQKHWMRRIKQRWVKSRRRWSRRYEENVSLLSKGRWGTSERLYSGLTFPTVGFVISSFSHIYHLPISPPPPMWQCTFFITWNWGGWVWFRDLGLFKNHVGISRVRELIHCQPLIPSLTSPPQHPCLFFNPSPSRDAFRVWGEMTSLMVYRPETSGNKRPRA